MPEPTSFWITFEDFASEVEHLYRGNRRSIIQKLEHTTRERVPGGFKTNKDHLHDTFIDLKRLKGRQLTYWVSRAVTFANSQEPAKLVKLSPSFIDDLANGDGSGRTAAAMHYYLIVFYKDHATKLNKAVLGDEDPREFFRREVAEDSPKSLIVEQDFPWGLEHSDPLTLDRVSYAVKMLDGGDVPNEPSSEVPIFLHVMTRISTIEENFEFGFNKVYVLLDIEHSKQVEVKLNTKYWGKGVHCVDAKAQLFGHGSRGFLELRVPSNSEALHAQYDLIEKDEPVLRVSASAPTTDKPEVSAVLVGRTVDMRVVNHPEDVTLDQAKTALLCKLQEKAELTFKPITEIKVTPADIVLSYHKSSVYVSCSEDGSSSE